MYSQQKSVNHVIDVSGIDEMLLVANTPHSARSDSLKNPGNQVSIIGSPDQVRT